jgi:hypothetical protein
MVTNVNLGFGAPAGEWNQWRGLLNEGRMAARGSL